MASTNKTNPAMLTIAEASAMIAKKEISAVELTEACLARIKKRNGELIAYVTVLEERALKEAAEADAEIAAKGPKSALHGIPYALKDLYFTKGIRTSAGSRFFQDYLPDYDSTIGQRLAAAGGVLMGKTNTSEWALDFNTQSCFGQSRNPWDPERAPGGSSGGSCIAVADGMALMATGSDTGCSIRLPASFCGVTGFKPTRGLLSCYGIFPFSYTSDHPGPIGRSVMDLALIMDLITGYDPLDPCPSRAAGGPTNFAAELLKTKQAKDMVIGIPSNVFFEGTDEEVEALIMKAVDSLKLLGAKVKYIDIPHPEWIGEVPPKLIFSEAALFHKERLASNPELFGDFVRDRLESYKDLPAAEYIDAIKKRDILCREWEEVMTGVDVVAAPVAQIAAYKLKNPTVKVRGEESPVAPLVLRNCRFAPLAGIPALSVPVGLNSEGMPVGLMLMSGRGRDLDVLKAGWAYEQANPFPVLPDALNA